MRSSRSFLSLATRYVALMSALIVNAPGAGDPYRLAFPNYRFEFPRDHFNHPDFQTEWWYWLHGDLRTAEGRRFGFELTFFRQGVDRQPASNVWDVQDVWMAHLALSDINGRAVKAHRTAEPFWRGRRRGGRQTSSRLEWQLAIPMDLRSRRGRHRHADTKSRRRAFLL